MDEGLVEKHRGLGMFVRKGAYAKLIASEREKFLNREWPALLKRLKQLGLDVNELLAGEKDRGDDEK